MATNWTVQMSPRATGSGNVQEPSGSEVALQQIRRFELYPTRHKVFLSHSGAQKHFVEQLFVDLKARGYLFPFFDQSHYSLPKGKDFVPLIKRAARQCHVAVIVLSKEFLCSKWPMIELAEFYAVAVKQYGNKGMSMLPLFYKLSVDDLDDKSIDYRWMPKWNELARKDKRIDVTQWAAAVRALRGVNGLPFGKNTNSEVGYRKEIVESICRLSPRDLMYGSDREMVGYHRICQRVFNRFVRDTRVGASVLGLYGTSGSGKTTLSKALCDYYAREFMGRVCHVDLAGDMSRMKRQKLMLKTLCDIEENELNRLTDDLQGLNLMRDYMKWEPVFLVIDNVTNDKSLRKEAHEYLTVGFHPRSKIVITARSIEVLQDLLPGLRFCMSIPRLNEEEAGRIFLRSAAPMKCFSSLTEEERTILGLCIEKCLLEADNGELCLSFKRCRAYHPLALSALGEFFYNLGTNTKMLCWKDSLEANKDLMRDFLQSPSITRVIFLQFSTLSSREQLLFLDVALYCKYPPQEARMMSSRSFDYWVEWLSALHGETASVIERRLRDLKRSGMINWGKGSYDAFETEVHSLYKEFAVWYVREHGVTRFKNAWGVFQPCGSSLGSHHPGSKCKSDLVRLRVYDFTRSTILTLLRNNMLELQYLVLLQLYSCTDLRELSLAGLDSLRHLELCRLSNLVSVSMTRSSGLQEDGGILESLQYVVLQGLDSLTHVPDFTSCSSLRYLRMWNCQEVTNFEGMECPHLRELVLSNLALSQLEFLPNFRSLHCLQNLQIWMDGEEPDFGEAQGVCDYINRYKQGYLDRLEQWGHVEGGLCHQGPEEDSNYYFSDDPTCMKDIKVIDDKTIINMHLENHFGKEGLSILQKLLTMGSCCPNILEWSFNEGDKEVLEVYSLNAETMKHCIEWRFNDPEEYDDYSQNMRSTF